jgi:hypothetical protein
MTHTQRRVRWSTVAASAAAAALVAGGATSADAGPAFVEHWDDDFSFVHPDGSADFCGDLGFDVVEHVQESGSFVGVNRGPDGLWYGAAKFRGTITWTNPENGRNYRNEYSGSDRDQKVTDVDGTITLQGQLTGPNRYYDNGTLAFVDTGMVRYTVTFDDGGTPTDPSDDGEAEFVSLDKITGLRETDGRDFCTDIALFLG